MNSETQNNEIKLQLFHSPLFGRGTQITQVEYNERGELIRKKTRPMFDNEKTQGFFQEYNFGRLWVALLLESDSLVLRVNGHFVEKIFPQENDLSFNIKHQLTNSVFSINGGMNSNYSCNYLFPRLRTLLLDSLDYSDIFDWLVTSFPDANAIERLYRKLTSNPKLSEDELLIRGNAEDYYRQVKR